MSNVAESQIITNTGTSDKRIESSLEKLPRHLFFSTIEFFITDIESFINFRRCDRKIFSLCTEGLRIYLGRITELNFIRLSLIRLLPQNKSKTNPLFPLVSNVKHLKLNGFFKSHISPSEPIKYSRFFQGLNQNCKNLRSVTIEHLYIRHILDILPHIGHEITYFEFNGSVDHFGNQLLEEIGARFPNLEHLKLNLMFGLTLINNSATKSILTKCVKLKTLHMIGYNELDYQIANYFANCKNITDLNFATTLIGARGIQKIVESCLKLTILNVQGNIIDDEAMQVICNRNPTRIAIRRCTPYQFLMLANCTELTQLVITACDVTDADVKYVLEKCEKLIYVCITQNKIIDSNNILKRFPKIKFFI